jgi:iron complex outermembrane receptor protein
MSLNQLANVKVTSVSKTEEKANQAAAAVYVITQEDIKRSGATSIPEALRMAPGIEVAQAGAHDWAVSSRGFNGQFANKLLILIDGRTVYNPAFSGTFWQLQDTVLEDIDRIEVIRGPGAAQWGANAVNGVINIITKSAKDTQGGIVSASVGNMIKTDDSVRYGVKLGDDSYARVYAKYNDDAPQFNVGSGRSDDGWQKQQAGFRSDSKISSQDSLTLQGDAYTSHESELYNLPSLTSMTGIAITPGDIDASGGNVLGRWTRNISPESTTTTQVYFDNTQYKSNWAAYNTNTADFDFQHIWKGWERNEVVWGVGYRLIEDHEGTTPIFAMSPADRSDSVFSAFLQDKYTLHPDDLFLTLGSKFENNPYTGFEVQPSARLSYLISDTQMTWGSVSRAVHTANRFTDDADPLLLGVAPPGIFHPGVPALVGAVGNQGLDSEDLIAYELGYRIQPTKTLSFDVATFYNQYRNLFTGTYGQGYLAGGGAYWFQPIYAANENTAHSEGVELSVKADVTKNWQMAASYTYLDLIFAQKTDPAFVFTNNPKNQFSVRSTYLFPYDIQMTNSLYYVAGLAQSDIPGYYRFDTKLSHEILPGVEASLVGQNLLQAEHKEFNGFLYQNPIEVGRSVYANITWKF